MLDLDGKRIKYNVAQIFRSATKKWLQYEIAPEEATTVFGCGFGERGWHHIRQTLDELEAKPDLSTIDTTLYKYLSQFKPSSICDLVSCSKDCSLPLFDYPWGSFSKLKHAKIKNPKNSRFCGPSSDEFIFEELKRILLLKKELVSDGYKPNKYPNSFISGTWLIDNSLKRKKFVVMQGNHRLAILAHLGINKIPVRSTRLAISSVSKNDISRWPAVVSGKCSEDDAEKIFNFFFENNGHHVRSTLE